MQQDRDQERGTEASPLSLVSESTALAFADARESFERFCLVAGIEAMEALLDGRQSSRFGGTHRRRSGMAGPTFGFPGLQAGRPTAGQRLRRAAMAIPEIRVRLPARLERRTRGQRRERLCFCE